MMKPSFGGSSRMLFLIWFIHIRKTRSIIKITRIFFSDFYDGYQVQIKEKVSIIVRFREIKKRYNLAKNIDINNIIISTLEGCLIG